MTGFELVKKVGAKDIIAIKINEEFKDLGIQIPEDVSEEQVQLISKQSQDGLEILRHSCAHLMACAIQKLYPSTKFTIGPCIENGFYYDIALEQKISENDFGKIENVMKEFVEQDLKFTRKEVSRQEALEVFKDNKFKVEIINELPENVVISLYYLGDYVDLCRGPHVPSTRYLKNFKLTKVSGAYWKADAKNEQLQRIYGTCFDTKENLDNYFKFLEEAERRDHKKICKAMDLCHWEPQYAPGAAFWHPKGRWMWLELENFLRQVKYDNGYVECQTPTLLNRCLWETSGHWAHYGEKNYSGKTSDDMTFAVKPMNCPGGILIYNSSPKSYKDLPIRMMEFGRVDRFESFGSLNGLLRCREFVQDDAHVWCTPEQLDDEIRNMMRMFYDDVYKVLGFSEDNVKIYLSTRPEDRIPNREHLWDASEKYLEESLKKNGYKFEICPGEGAFYGPKLEFHFRDALGRYWQIGTIQVDMNLPERFGMTYVGQDGQKHQPVMLHAACFGALDRFLGMYIETVEGKFPLWHNPIQAVILNVNDTVNDYCEEIAKKFKANKIRYELDLENKPLQQKIAFHSTEKIPYQIIIGKKEKETGTVSIKIFGEGMNAKPIEMKVEEFINKVNEKVVSKSLNWKLI